MGSTKKRWLQGIVFIVVFIVIVFSGKGTPFIGDGMEVYAAEGKLNYTVKHMLRRETFQLKLSGTGAKSITWSSSNPKVAKVSGNGKVTAKKAGTAIIKAVAGKRTYSCKIIVNSKIDLIIFAGQSNMMGHGNAAGAPELKEGAAYEYRSVTNPNGLKVLNEPFGYKQDSGGLVNGKYCTGSMVTAFCNSYFKQTKTPVVAVAATRYGSGSVAWSTALYQDVEARIKQSVRAVKKMGLKIDHCYLVWMHGENDVCAATPTDQYVERIGGMLRQITKDTSVEKCMLIQTGRIVYNAGTKSLADPNAILAAQEQICENYDEVILISNKATVLGAEFYQSDQLHFTQQGLNKIGTDAGKNAGKYAKKH